MRCPSCNKELLPAAEAAGANWIQINVMDGMFVPNKSVGLPLFRFPQAGSYPLISIPLLLATCVIVRQTGVTRHDLGLRRGDVPVQFMLAGFRLGLGALE